MDEPLLHLLTSEEWNRQPTSEPLRAATLATEGFAHCTVGDELMLRVANNFYSSQAGEFVVVSLDRQRITAELRWEFPPGADPLAGVAFPHVYGPIDADAVVNVRDLLRGPDGAFIGFGAGLTL